MKSNFFLVLVFSTISVFSQTESVHLQLDKDVCNPGETIWFRAFVFNNNLVSHLSTNLNIEVYSDSNKLMQRLIFPIIKGVSFGEVMPPIHEGFYWLRAYTKIATPYLQSITVVKPGKPVIVRKQFSAKWVSVTENTDAMLFNTILGKTEVVANIIPDSASMYNDQPFTLLIKSYDDTISRLAFILNKGRQRIITIKKDSVPVGYLTLCFFNADTLVERQDIFIPQRPVIANLSVETTLADSTMYNFKIADTTDWNYSLSVSKIIEDAAQRDITNCLSLPAGKQQSGETSFLTYDLVAKNAKNALPNESFFTILGTDSTTLNKIICTDSTSHLQIKNMYFFGSAKLSYQATKDKRVGSSLVLVPEKYPAFIEPDRSRYELDTLHAPITEETELPFFDTAHNFLHKTLKEVTVNASWQKRDKAIDDRFTTGRFSEPTLFHWNIMKDDLEYTYDIWEFLKRNYTGFDYNKFDVPNYNLHYVTFYVDEQCVNYQDIPTHMDEIAYIKIITGKCDDDAGIRIVSGIPPDSIATYDRMPKTSLGTPVGGNAPFGSIFLDNSPKAMICIYKRNRDEDFRMNSSRLKLVVLKGYTKPVSWTKPDKETMLWDPYIDSNVFRFKLPRLGDQKVKLTVEGVNQFGETFHFEKIISRLN